MTTTLPAWAMVNDAGDLFYPDGPDDARWFVVEHEARPVDPALFPWPGVVA
jgi:hypothetical protein